MKNKEDLQHYERLLNFFNFELKVDDGEYPFYTDDRLLTNNDTFKKKVYRDGKRRSINVHPVSIHTKRGKKVIEKVTLRQYKIDTSKQFHNPFITFVVHRWEEFVTKKQKQFILDVLDGKEHLYSKQLRYKYRNNIQKRLKMAFIGSGGDCVSIYKLGEFRTNLNIIQRFLEVDHDNDLYSREIVKNIDKEYVNQIVYERLSPEARMEIVKFYFGKIPKIKPVHLYEFHSIIMDDKERFEIMGLA